MEKLSIVFLKVQDSHEWSDCLEEEDNRIYFLGKELDSGSDFVTDENQDLQIVGLTAICIANIFLADDDMNNTNIRVKRLKDRYQVVKIDPEGCFSTSFFLKILTYYGIEDEIFGELRDPLNQKTATNMSNAFDNIDFENEEDIKRI